MKAHITLFLDKLVSALGLRDESTAVERLAMFIQEQKHQTLLERIKAIRTNSPYEPDYNKPPVHTEVVILYKVIADVYAPICGSARLAQERPLDFGNDIKAWKKIIFIDHKKELKAKQLKQLQKEQRKEFFDTEVSNYVMQKMLKVN